MKAVASLLLMLVLLRVGRLSNAFGAPGGLSQAASATENVQQLCNQVRGEVEVLAGRNFDEYTAIEYKHQVVAGMNYFVKVRVGTDDYIQVNIYQPPANAAPSLTSYKDIGQFEEIGF